MRTVLILLCTLFTVSLSAQNSCSTYFPFKEGMTLEYQYYNKKDKLEGTSIQSVQDVSENGGEITAKVSTQMTDAKGKESIDGSFTVTCSGGIFEMDMSQMVPAESMAALGGGDAEMKMSGDGFRLPTDAQIGQDIPDSENTIEIKAGVMNMNMTLNLIDQKVEARETITTPAGTFDCLRFSYVASTKMSIMKTENRTVNWYADGVGTVRSETYNKKGKLQSYMLLSGFEE